MSSARQLLYQYVQGHVTDWYSPFVLNMRQIRGYDNYWRPIDTEAYIDGPVSQQMGYSKDEIIWKVEIVKDIEDNLTNTLNLYKVLNYTEAVAEYNSWDEIPNFKYNLTEPTFTYEHTDPIDSVSLEFDQSGRRLIAFESAGDVNFIWYDPVPAEFVVTNYGAGYNPFIVTDTYRRTGGSADSERLLFYVKDSTKQIVYRRQLDRYQTEYTLPSAPADIVELLKVSKNIYGGLTALFCYDDGSGNLVDSSFTARNGVDQVAVGTDGSITEASSMSASSGTITSFNLRINSVSTEEQSDTAQFIISSGTLSEFSLALKTIETEEQVDSSSFSVPSGTVSSFELKNVSKETAEQTDTATFGVTAGTLSSFLQQVALIEHTAETESATMSINTGTLSIFTLG